MNPKTRTPTAAFIVLPSNLIAACPPPQPYPTRCPSIDPPSTTPDSSACVSPAPHPQAAASSPHAPSYVPPRARHALPGPPSRSRYPRRFSPSVAVEALHHHQHHHHHHHHHHRSSAPQLPPFLPSPSRTFWRFRVRTRTS